MSQVNGYENGYEKVELRKKKERNNAGSTDRPASSGFQSFLKFFGKNSENRVSTASESNYEERNNNNNNYGKIRQRLRSSESPGNSSSSGGTDSSPTLLELGSSSTELSSSSSTSCDSLFSIATTGFNFVPVDIYQPDGNTLKVIFLIKF